MQLKSRPSARRYTSMSTTYERVAAILGMTETEHERLIEGNPAGMDRLLADLGDAEDIERWDGCE